MDINLRKKSMQKINSANQIIEEYMAAGYQLTLRQLYYQMVARGYIANNNNEYRGIAETIKFGRLSGLVDWEAIVDRTRTPKDVYVVDGAEDAVSEALKHFRLDRQQGQKNHVEVWVEKDAISSLLWTKASHYGVTLMVNRGYSSVTAMYEAAMRMKDAERQGKTNHILYFGDHDPSGLDMLRDISQRQDIFEQDPILKHVGITMPQIKQLNPPPFPAKITDPRVSGYIAEHGDTAWELDALPPEELFKIMENEIEALLDMGQFHDRVSEEAEARAELSVLWEKGVDFTEFLGAYGELRQGRDKGRTKLFKGGVDSLDTKSLFKVVELEDDFVKSVNSKVEPLADKYLPI